MSIYHIRIQNSRNNYCNRKLHVHLFSSSSPLPLSEWYRKRSDCCMKRKSLLENFPRYIRNFKDNEKIPSRILDELHQIRFKKPTDKPKYYINLLHYAFLLRHTSTQF